MTAGILEHINITVSNPGKTAERLSALFGWTIRWSGKATNSGHTVHVGGKNSYLAVYSKGSPSQPERGEGKHAKGLNHVGVVVDDLEKVERRVNRAGFETYNFGEYEPGRRFYFRDSDGIEFEVVSYQPKTYPWRQSFFTLLGKMSENGSLMK